MKTSTAKFLFGFIAGAAAGAVAGLLLAPEKGSDTRKLVAEKAKKYKEDLEKEISGKVDDLKEFVNESVDEMKTKISKAEKKAHEVEAEVKKAAK
jgi:gas vesicle protein